MITTVDRPTLVSTGELQLMLGVSRKRTYELSRRADFPAPYATFLGGWVAWDLADVQRWADDHGRTLLPLDASPAGNADAS